jgi:DNA repair protein RecN (Recombination protein N)
MLKNLSIKNYALIEKLEISFDQGLNILTGETGAGKSIILGALGLVMGKRADLKSMLDPAQNCLVEAIVDISRYELSDLLAENDIEEDRELQIRRVITKSGKSRAFINDLPVNLNVLEAITSKLIQMHNQFDSLDLVDPAYQLSMLDALAGNDHRLAEYQLRFQEWQENLRLHKKLLGDKANFEKEKDFLQYQFDELCEIDLEAAIEDNIEATLELLSNAEAIQQGLQSAHFILTEDENAVVSQLNALAKQLHHAGSGTIVIKNLLERIYAQIEELGQLSNDIFDQAEKIESDPKKIEELESKQTLINKLLMKHKADALEDLANIKRSLEERLSHELQLDDQLVMLEQKISDQEKQLFQYAEDLSKRRKEAAYKFSKKLVDQLKTLAMPHARISNQFIQNDELGPTGFDEYEILFTANKGSAPESIRQVASGGELSRLSLSIKSILAAHMSLPTLIFDEIESGISGEVAKKMGMILKTLSASHQVINITHSAQIASRGQRHFFVFKSHEKDRTLTQVKILDPEEKIIEIAKMLSGDPPTPTAIKNAEELIHLN